jgi:hypothetical protein
VLDNQAGEGTDMILANNNIKNSAAVLIFFLSAAAWATHELIEEEQAPAINTTVQPDTVNSNLILRPLTD